MSAVVYLCEECGVTFEAEGGCCCQPAAVACPKCGSVKAQKQPEAPKPAGGCGCGDGCC